MPVAGSGTNSNMNGIRIESRVLAPPGGFSSISFGGEASNADKFKAHNFNPKTQKKLSEQVSKDVENMQPVHKNHGGNGSGIPGLESHYPTKVQATHSHTHSQVPVRQQQQQQAPVPAQQQQQNQNHQFPGRRGRGAGESSFSLSWE